MNLKLKKQNLQYNYEHQQQTKKQDQVALHSREMDGEDNRIMT